MKDNKPWYEKLGIWIGIVAGIFTILGISIFGDNFLAGDSVTNINEINLQNNEVESFSGNVIGDISTSDYSNIQNIESNNTYIENQYNLNGNIVALPYEDFITESYDINKLEDASFMEIKVRNKTDTAWGDKVAVNVGDQIEFQIEYKNTSDYDQMDVFIFDTLPENTEYVKGSLKLYDINHPSGENINPDDFFSDKGINVGNFKPDANVFIFFTIEITDLGLTDGIRTLKNETRYQVGTEEKTISKDHAYTIAHGWGPERPTYVNEHPADHPVFNSITDNIVLGDERNFVRIVELQEDENKEKNTYVDSLEIEPGKRYGVFIYYHNNAASKYNNAENDYTGVAWNVRISSGFPESMVKGEKGTVFGRITSTNTDPESVWDSAQIIAKEDVTLHFVLCSAKIHNNWGASDSVLSTYLFSNEGTFIGLDKLNGMIFGCYEYSGFITYTIEVESASNI